METRDKLTLIGIVAGIVTPLMITTLTGIPLLKFYPDYDLTLESYSNSTLQIEEINVKNIGLVQAKDASIFIFSKDELYVKSLDQCVEGHILKNNMEKIQKVEFDQISSNILCSISFSSSLIDGINKITIVSEDAPGKTFIPSKTTIFSKTQKGENIENYSIDLENKYFAYAQDIKLDEHVITAKITKFELEKNPDDKWIFYFTLLGITESIIVAIYGIRRLVKKHTTNEELKKKRQKIQVEIGNIRTEIDSITNDLEGKHKQKSTVKESIVEELEEDDQNNIVEELEGEYIINTRKLEEVNTLMSSDIIYHNQIKQFFEYWIILEKLILKIAMKKKIKVHGKKTRFIIVDLIQKNALSHGFFVKFESLREFRNQLAHGLVKITKPELEQQVNAIKELTTELLVSIDKKMAERRRQRN